MAKFKSATPEKSPAAARKPAPAKKAAATKAGAKKKAAPSKTASAKKILPGAIAPQTIVSSAQQLWGNSLQALGRAQQEGTRLFEALVKEGINAEKKTRSIAANKVGAVRGSVETRVEQVKDQVSDKWDRLEKVFEERVQRALVRLGVPGRDELQALIDRVDELNAQLRKLNGTANKPGSKAATSKTASTKQTTAKPASKTAAKKPATAKKAAAKPVANAPAETVASPATEIKSAQPAN